MEERLPRKLAAILYADVAGYSRLTGEDEEGTHRRLSQYLDHLSSEIKDHQGRLVHYAGDAVLADFPTATDALACAVSTQEKLTVLNQGLPEGNKVEFRIGINLGEVIVDRDDIYGDGVNIAARLESLAHPGGICISESVRTAIGKKLSVDYEYLGEQQVKNIAQPVRAYYVSTSHDQGDHKIPHFKEVTRSVAVLPFINMSGEQGQDYFSDGITEDIITELSRFRSLFVIARNSTFAYKGEKVDVKHVGRELGVQYVVEGSVRKAGQRVRITVQLIETANGNHKWAERYDRDLEDIFAVQDEVAQTIVSILPGRLDDAAFERTRRKPTESMTAYDYVLRGIKAFKHMTRENCVEAGQMYAKAIELDPEYARAYTLLANTYIWSTFMEWSTEEVLDQAMECCEKALLLDDNDSWAHAGIGFVMFLHKQDVKSENHFHRAMMLNPNDPDIAAFWADVLVYLGRWEEALDLINKAKRLNPFHPEYYDWYRALALYSAREYEQAVKSIKEMMNLDRWHHAYLAASYAHLNQLDDAHFQIAAFVDTLQKEQQDRGEVTSPVTLASASERANRYRNPSDREHFLDGLRKAGLPE